MAEVPALLTVTADVFGNEDLKPQTPPAVGGPRKGCGDSRGNLAESKPPFIVRFMSSRCELGETDKDVRPLGPLFYLPLRSCGSWRGEDWIKGGL